MKGMSAVEYLHVPELEMDLGGLQSALGNASDQFDGIELSLIFVETGIEECDLVVLFAESDDVGQHSPVVKL